MVTEEWRLPGAQAPQRRERLDDVLTHPEWVDVELAEQREAEQRLAQLQERRLGPALKALIWTLRVYVLFMAVVVIINVVQYLW
jgi:hypothetical protein